MHNRPPAPAVKVNICFVMDGLFCAQARYDSTQSILLTHRHTCITFEEETLHVTMILGDCIRSILYQVVSQIHKIKIMHVCDREKSYPGSNFM